MLSCFDGSTDRHEISSYTLSRIGKEKDKEYNIYLIELTQAKPRARASYII